MEIKNNYFKIFITIDTPKDSVQTPTTIAVSISTCGRGFTVIGLL